MLSAVAVAVIAAGVAFDIVVVVTAFFLHNAHYHSSHLCRLGFVTIVVVAVAAAVQSVAAVVAVAAAAAIAVLAVAVAAFKVLDTNLSSCMLLNAINS